MEARKASAPPNAKKGGGGGNADSGGSGGTGPIVNKLLTSSRISLARSESCMSRGKDSPDTDSTGKRIVEKLRSDVRVLRDVIRRSRRSNSR